MNATSPIEQDVVVDAMRRVLHKRFGIERTSIDLDQPIDSLGLDSMSFVEYVFDLETELNLVFPDIPTNLVTLGDFVRFITDQVNRAHRKDAVQDIK